MTDTKQTELRKLTTPEAGTLGELMCAINFYCHYHDEPMDEMLRVLMYQAISTMIAPEFKAFWTELVEAELAPAGEKV